MKKLLLVSILLLLSFVQISFAQSKSAAAPSKHEETTAVTTAESTAASETKSTVTELGITLPVRTSAIKSYLDAHGISTLPFTSGYSSGAIIGRHGIVSPQTTIGVVAGANFFIGTDSVAVSHVYQLSALLTARLFFGESWRGGFYAQIGAGAELSVAKFSGTPIVFQVNTAARAGLGYNYRFSDDVTVGLAILATPSLSDKNILDGTIVAVNMLW